MELKEYLHQKYQGSESFLENVIYPTFGKDCYQTAYDTDILEEQPQLHSLAESTGIGKFIHVGTLDLPFNPIEIFDITVVDRVQMSRNRVAIQLLVRRIISTYSSAFMIFHYEGDSKWDWRFTFCRKGATNLQGTDNKRYTFLLGPSQSCRTAADNFLKLSRKQGKIGVEDIISAFDVEALSNEFFDKYKLHYEEFVEYITGKRYVKKGNKWEEKVIHKPHPQMYADFGYDDKLVRDYVKRMMGRIVFLHFLQKKGWMGVPADKEWGDGDLQFMKHLYDNAKEDQKDNFLDLILEQLFVALDTNRIDNDFLFDTITMGTLKVPYLNGGLFTRDNLDKVDTKFPKGMFENLLEFLYQYNFTIDENDPGDAQVGIDPEMLGRIFENLLEDNKDKGAYYTPKEIVKYMCRESLKAYLQTDIIDKTTKEKISRFVETYDVAEIDGEKSDIAKLIDSKLKEVKICDPAIGSGAFPMGLLKELFFCRGAIEHFDNAADIKRHIIQNNIYGVDIERGAVDIARLRFWLSLIIDEKDPETLPNLDFKIMQGNSLLESYENIDLSKFASMVQEIRVFEPQKNLFGQIDEKERQMNLTFTEHNIANELSINLEKYYSVDDHNLRSKLLNEIEENVRDQIIYNLQIRIDPLLTIVEQLSASTKLTSSQTKSLAKFEKEVEDLKKVMTEIKSTSMVNDKFFLWHTWFNDVFNRPSKQGFDIVIGNPPYGAKLSKEEKFQLQKDYVTAKTENGLKGSLDTFTLFIELAYNLLCKNGTMSYIVPIALTSSDSLAGIHHLLLSKCEDIHISSYAVRPQPVFKNAVVNTSIILYRKTLSPCKHLYSTKMYRKGRNFNLQYLVNNLEFTDVRELVLYGRIPKISLPIERRILIKILHQKRLGEYLKDCGKPIVYRFAGGRYFKVVTNYSNNSSAERTVYFEDKFANPIGCILSSNLSFWFYQIYSDNLNWKNYEFSEFRIPVMNEGILKNLELLYSEYLSDIEHNANIRQTTDNSSYNISSFKEYKIGKSKSIIDKIDDLICPLYGLNEEETAFIKNYEIEFRLSDEE